MLLELNIIQNFSPSCLNRSETNAPKDCDFGGYRRARISSQCYKRAIRLHPDFQDKLDDNIGIRTRLIYDEMNKYLIDKEKDETDIEKILTSTLSNIASKVTDKKTDVILFLSKKETIEIAKLLNHNWDSLKEKKEKDLKKDTEKILKDYLKAHHTSNISPDIALFGRMMASLPDMNIDSATYVAHSISTNKVDMEMDFYTAIDDLQTQEDSGAGMMGNIFYNSSCFYRYLAVDTNQLSKNLEGQLEKEKLFNNTIKAFISSSIKAIPVAKQTSMTAFNPPAFVMIVENESNHPFMLSNAFETPIRPKTDESLSTASIKALNDYYGRLKKIYGEEGKRARYFCIDDIKGLDNVGDNVENINELIDKTVSNGG